jgi:beta-glucosidase
MSHEFGDDFFFGTATSAFQIEGRSPNIPQGDSIWDSFCALPGRIADRSNGLIACNHVERYVEDVALMKKLNMGVYRFSIAWPKIIPKGRGVVSPPGLDFYDRLVDELLDAGITPFPTLYHWDLPQELDDDGGWMMRETAEAFADYTTAVVERLGDRIPTWMTLNEPYVSAGLGYVTGEHAPGHRSLDAGLAVAHNLLLAHGMAMERIRASAPQAEVGIVLNFTPAKPASTAPADVAAADIRNAWENEWYIGPIMGKGYPERAVEALGWNMAIDVRDGDLDLISAPIDVLGVNYYTRQVVSAVGQTQPLSYQRTQMGWEVHPESLRALLVWIHENYAPPKMVITENGAAMSDTQVAEGRINDTDRIDYLRRHLIAVHQAKEDGVPMVGYLAWSLMDNFEWALGYTKNFGLVEIEERTLNRKPKASAYWFGEVARTGVVPDA